jgi:hypothetical protein
MKIIVDARYQVQAIAVPCPTPLKLEAMRTSGPESPTASERLIQ